MRTLFIHQLFHLAGSARGTPFKRGRTPAVWELRPYAAAHHKAASAVHVRPSTGGAYLQRRAAPAEADAVQQPCCAATDTYKACNQRAGRQPHVQGPGAPNQAETKLAAL
jgi:hypothetical protein